MKIELTSNFEGSLAPAFEHDVRGSEQLLSLLPRGIPSISANSDARESRHKGM
jgi:hypothetical protein